MHKEAREELRVRLKLVVLELADHLGVTKACREFDVPRSSYYRWKQKYEKVGQSGLYRERPIAYHHPHKSSPEAVEKILELRREYQFGALRIKYYLERYQGIRISQTTVSRVLKAHGVARLPKTAPLFLTLFLSGGLVAFALVSCANASPILTFGSPVPSTTTQTPLYYVYTPTATPPMIQFPNLSPGETPVIVKGTINTLGPTLKVYSGPGFSFPVYGELNNDVEVDVMGRRQEWLYISYSNPNSKLTGWVVALDVFIEKDDANKISLAQVVTPTVFPFLP